MNKKSGKFLRVIAIILMAMTAAMNIMGGIGTSCAAFFTKKYPPYWVLIKPVDYRWLYQLFVITTLAIGIAGVIVIVGLIRGKKNAFRNTLIVLLIGSVLNAIHYFTSLTVIGKAAPANVVFYINLITLVVFLILSIPRLRATVNFERDSKNSDKMAGGVAAMVIGTVILSTPMWAGASHAYMGSNWVDVLAWPIYIGGTILVLIGLTLLGRAAWISQDKEVAALEFRTP
jgi:roadblock/LC7 domain-containing protein